MSLMRLHSVREGKCISDNCRIGNNHSSIIEVVHDRWQTSDGRYFHVKTETCLKCEYKKVNINDLKDMSKEQAQRLFGDELIGRYGPSFNSAGEFGNGGNVNGSSNGENNHVKHFNAYEEFMSY